MITDNKNKALARKALAATLELYHTVMRSDTEVKRCRKLKRLLREYFHIEGQMSIAVLDAHYHYHDLRTQIKALLNARRKSQRAR